MVYVEFSTNLRRTFLVLAILLASIIVVKSVTPALPSLSLSNMDKVIHVAAYFALGLVALPALPRVRPLYIWFGLCALGASIELAQGLMNAGRTANILDGVANATGAVLAIAVWLILTRLTRKFT